MAKMSKEQVMAQLEILKISYDETTSYAELVALLPKGNVLISPEKEAEIEKERKIEQVKSEALKMEADVVVPQVPLGVSTINDHELRLWAIERKLGLR